MEIEIVKYIVEQFGPYSVIVWMYWTSARRYEDMFTKLAETIKEGKSSYEKICQQQIALTEISQKMSDQMKELILMNTDAWKSAEATLRSLTYCHSTGMSPDGKYRASAAVGMQDMIAKEGEHNGRR